MKALLTTPIDLIALQWAYAFHGGNPALQPLPRNGRDASAAIADDQALRDWKGELLGVLNMNARLYSARSLSAHDDNDTEAPSVHDICDSMQPVEKRMRAAHNAKKDGNYTSASEMREALTKLQGVIFNRYDITALRLASIRSYVGLVASEKWRLTLEEKEWEQSAIVLFNVATQTGHNAIKVKESSYAALGVLSDTWPYPLEKMPQLKAVLPQLVSSVAALIDSTEETYLRTTAIGVFGMLYAGGYAECSDIVRSVLQRTSHQDDDAKCAEAADRLLTLVARTRSAPE